VKLVEYGGAGKEDASAI